MRHDIISSHRDTRVYFEDAQLKRPNLQMAFTPKFIPNDGDNLDEEPLEEIRVVIPEIEEILDERKFISLKKNIYIFFFSFRAFLCFVLCTV